MTFISSYTLLDFGNARRLERFGNAVIDRPCPAAADAVPKNSLCWKTADYRFIASADGNERGTWQPCAMPIQTVDFGSFALQLRGTPFGHLGVFPEQQTNWQRIANLLQSDKRKSRPALRRVLNLFAYTGGSSLAAAMQNDTETVHIDSSKSVVEWAKHNAALNGVENKIRFITEDVRKFVKREIKRSSRYDAVILDPPTYGHGVKGEAWKIADDLSILLDDVGQLLTQEPLFVLLTAHTPTLDSDGMRRLFDRTGWTARGTYETFSMSIPAQTGAVLPLGCGIILHSEPQRYGVSK